MCKQRLQITHSILCMKCLTYVNVCKTKIQISQAVSADRAMNYVICKVKSTLFPFNI